MRIFSKNSAKKQIILFLLVYFFTIGDKGKAPIETIIPQAKEMPLYKIINDPFSVLFEREDVKMANFSTRECLVA